MVLLHGPFIHAKEKGQEAEETEEAEQIKKTEEEETLFLGLTKWPGLPGACVCDLTVAGSGSESSEESDSSQDEALMSDEELDQLPISR